MTASLHKLRNHPSSRTERNLHFPWAGVSAAIEEAKTASRALPLYDDHTGRGLWLVGDQGVYLMSNAAIDKPTVVYANECDPTKLPFETWWEAKRTTFGGDDGVEFISVDEIEGLTTSSPRFGARPYLWPSRSRPVPLRLAFCGRQSDHLEATTGVGEYCHCP